MNNNTELKELWNKKTSEIPDPKEIISKADKFRSKSLRRLILTNILLILTSAFIGFIWYYFQPELITTKIGIVIVILAMLLYLIVYNLMIPLLFKTDYSMNTSQYLQQLLKLKEKQRFLQSTMMSIYFLMLTFGLVLYMYEYSSKMNFPWDVLSYIITLLWISFTWFYLRPKSIKKQDKAINDILGKFEKIKMQLNNEQEQ